MLVRIKQIRPGGSVITLGKGKEPRRNYHFKPLDPKKPDEDHVCDVTDSDDLSTLLAIKEGYEIHPDELKSKQAKSVTADLHKAENKARADEQARAKADAEAEVQRRIEAEKPRNQPPDPNAPTPKDYRKMTKPQLLRLVAERTGKKPHPSASGAKLVAQLEDLDRAGK